MDETKIRKLFWNKFPKEFIDLKLLGGADGNQTNV